LSFSHYILEAFDAIVRGKRILIKTTNL
jgi:hypothetical protein